LVTCKYLSSSFAHTAPCGTIIINIIIIIIIINIIIIIIIIIHGCSLPTYDDSSTQDLLEF